MYLVKQIFKKIKKGTFEVTFPNGEVQIFGSTQNTPIKLKINSKKAVSYFLKEGDIGFGRGYIEGWWECDDLVGLLSGLMENINDLESAIYGNKLYNFFHLVVNFFRRNTLSNSKKNIQYHYDLGNDFYFKWLDATKSYSSGIFYGDETLEEAQKNKYQNIIKYLPEDAASILEIGFGWGGFISEILKSKPHINLTGLTLSNQQFDYTSKAFHQKNINLKIEDYRNEKDVFDAIVSIEMFEAVGMEYWQTYFKKLHACLKPNGVAIVQTITIAEDVFQKYVHTSDFIRHFIFPGGMLPTKFLFEKHAKEAGLKVVKAENFGMSYYKTLIKWLEAFDLIKPEILNLGYSEEFIRKWRFYLAFCAVGFYFKRTDVFQFVLQK